MKVNFMKRKEILDLSSGPVTMTECLQISADDLPKLRLTLYIIGRHCIVMDGLQISVADSFVTDGLQITAADSFLTDGPQSTAEDFVS